MIGSFVGGNLVWGTILGVGPFSFAYALPWALGIDPPFAFQLTAIPLGLVPLTFASALVRYRLRDIEVRGSGARHSGALRPQPSANA